MLSEQLKVLYATNFHFFIKALFFHHNVTGASFVQLHELFGKIYEDAYSAIDVIAEEIRTLQSNPPGSFARFNALSLIEDQTQIPRAQLMIEELLADSEILISCLSDTFHFAEDEDKQDIANFMAERLGQHQKWAWQLRSLLDVERT